MLRDKGRTRAAPIWTTTSWRGRCRSPAADAAWVGWGFVAEDPAFAELCAELGVTFIGPPPEAMRLLGDKIEAKVLAEADRRAGRAVERRPGRRPSRTALQHAAADRLPDDPQGPQRRRRARHPDGVRSEASWRRRSSAPRSEAQKHVRRPGHLHGAAGPGRPAHRGAGHRRQHGNAWAPGVRDCSIQRRNQKVIEESSSPALTAEQDDDAARVGAIALVKAAGYAARAPSSSSTSRRRSCSPSWR